MPALSGILLIVRADDIGSSHAANLACMRALRDGIARSTELMAPCAWFPEAVELLKELPAGRDVGVHLTLTSEWENVKWRPLTRCPSLADANGYFLPRIWPRHDDDLCLKNKPWQIDEVEAELRAQIELCRANVSRLSHLSYHMGCDDADPQINALCRRLGEDYGLDIDLFAAGFRRVPQVPAGDNGDAIAQLARRLESLPSGKWILIDHPSQDTPEMRGISKTYGSSVATQRQSFTDACCDPGLMDLIRARGIQLISYSEIDTLGGQDFPPPIPA